MNDTESHSDAEAMPAFDGGGQDIVERDAKKKSRPTTLLILIGVIGSLALLIAMNMR